MFTYYFRVPKKITRHYTETGSGKGAPDGIGGAIKRCADRLVAICIDIPNSQTLKEKNTKAMS